jgi:hypothetical protein
MKKLILFISVFLFLACGAKKKSSFKQQEDLKLEQSATEKTTIESEASNETNLDFVEQNENDFELSFESSSDSIVSPFVYHFIEGVDTLQTIQISGHGKFNLKSRAQSKKSLHQETKEQTKIETEKTLQTDLSINQKSEVSESEKEVDASHPFGFWFWLLFVFALIFWSLYKKHVRDRKSDNDTFA